MLKNLSNEYILFVDDDELWLENTLRGLKILGLKKVEGCSDPLKVLDLLKTKNYSLIVIDLWMPQKPGKILLNEITQHFPAIPVMIITADNQIDTAVECMQNGAVNYLTKPIEPNQVIAHIRQIIQNHQLKQENSNLTRLIHQGNLEAPVNYFATLSQTVDMQKNFEFIDTLTQSTLPVLITGEKGCGKRQLALSIHNAHRRNGDFAEFDLSHYNNQDWLFDTLNSNSLSNISLSQNGLTIFLNNAELLSANSQYLLIDFFQNFQDKYNSSVISIFDFPKIILSSTINLIEYAAIIPDLKFLLKIQHIYIKPLRERKIDISLLAKYFIDQYVAKNNINSPHVPKELLPLLEQYQFPGNIYELKIMFEHALKICNRGKLSLESFKEHMDKHRQTADISKSINVFSSCSVLPTLKEAQSLLITEALERTNNNQAHAAHLLGITRQGLNRKIQSFGINSDFDL